MKLTTAQIETLKKQGCQATDWAIIDIDRRFPAENIHNVFFAGESVKLCAGTGGKEPLPLTDGLEMAAGIFNATIADCTVEHGCHISNVGTLRGCHIAAGSVVRNVNTLACCGESTFGEGTVLNVINEAGGREIAIHSGMTVQEAHILATYPATGHAAKKYERKKTGYIKGTITNCGRVENLCLNGGMLDGCTEVDDATVNQAIIGAGVIARHFVAEQGAEVTDGAFLERVYVGQGTQIGVRFSATDCFFASNCQAFNGEAVSLLAGPFTVTHHKASLLIACETSFLNVGSSSTQSNHLYKFGPDQQGTLGRGCKLASTSYLMWPASVGAFTTVMGHIGCHPSTADFPFSYLIEENGKTYLVPGVAYFGVGLARDERKWKSRDKRVEGTAGDFIHFEALNPYTIERLLAGLERLKRVEKTMKDSGEAEVQNGVYIKANSLRKGIERYRDIVSIYVGQKVAEGVPAAHGVYTAGEWTDAAGMVMPASLAREISTREDIHDCLCMWQKECRQTEWDWIFTAGLYAGENRREVLLRYKQATERRLNSICEDARKAYGEMPRTGYGVNSRSERDEDFGAVHGTIESNAFMRNFAEECMDTVRRIEEMMREG